MRTAIAGHFRTFLDVIEGCRLALAVMWRAAPRLTATTLVVMVLASLEPAATLLVQRAIVDRVVGHLGIGGPVEFWTATVIALVIAFALLSAVDEIAGGLLVVLSQILQDIVALRVTRSLLEKVSAWPTLDLHESPVLLDRLRLAQQGMRGFQSIGWTLFSAASGPITMVPLIFLLGSVGWWIPVVMIIALLPVTWLQFRFPAREWAAREHLAGQERTRDLLYRIGTETGYARDFRLYGAGAAIIDQWDSISSRVIGEVNRVRGRLIALLLGWSVPAGLVVAIPVAWVVNVTTDGGSTVGDLVLVIGSILGLRRSLWMLIANAGELVNETTGIRKYRDFMETEPPADTGTAALPPLRDGLWLEGLTFHYPGTDQIAIDGLDLTLRQGESVALVGRNGAGKTTLARLITRLFDPTDGRVCWDGLDVREVTFSALRERIAMVSQDFAELPLTLRENVAIGRLNDPPSDEEIAEALRGVGLGELLERGATPLDMPLTKELEGGTQLSGGQWQRLAIARAMMRAPQADLVILDEPTAALDPITEKEIVRHMLALTSGKTSLVISHRLGICTLVDRVIVLRDGKIIEDGPHRDLLAAGGSYATMFRAQAEWYRDKSA